ncbi:polyamine aminopropyltransferase [Cytobacillus depressus]|uniref:Polyamine aminopropyltransferase n=1 Tax=Cytobacillus depressus TaxID=1602942 RepID=A0A6L3VBX6_9BACI|nr:polyamine aminopropyltransferase [Cytobacillus depressus]KAB2338652.1 polyamine aminopropyltransferase [Cytobacillus depressus]
MTERNSLSGFKKDENGVVWIWNYVGNAKIKIGYKVKKLLHHEQSKYQQISVVDSDGFGRILVLDGTPQISTFDGFIYNEMICHVPIVTHENPKRVAMIGGGDCGNAREAMKYKGLEQIDVIEIDEKVTEICHKWLTPSAVYEKDKRFKIIHKDGFEWIKENKNQYDVLIIDRPDPVGPGKKLFEPDFYEFVYDCLTDDGVVAFQSGSPYYNTSTLRRTFQNLREKFPIVRTYLVSIPLFPCGIWSFTLASKKWDPLQADLSKLEFQSTEYITPEVFKAAFALPTYIQEILDD